LKHLKVLQAIPFLSPLSEDDLSDGLTNGKLRVVSYTKDNILHFEGRLCANLEIILSGHIVVDHIDESGNFMTISDLYSGDILGGNILFSQNPYYLMTLIAKSNVTILEIEKYALLDLLFKRKDFLVKYLEFVSDRSFILGDKIRYSVNRTIREKLLMYLELESKKQKTNHIILPMTKKQLAERIGVQRTSLSRELAKMVKDGLVEVGANSITLVKE